ncbi:hypothetical protein [Flavicella marina]|uniref:hypothetical protein n=1 Tax=Flavicella marina TaxID=1475951 RepID=UPI001265047B|nr:hypothetical protein [Flavicella marina]
MKKQLLLLLFFCTVFQATDAQEKSETIRNRIPMLNGHRFATTTQLKSPFIATSLSTDVGFGSTSLITIPGVEIGDRELFRFQGKIFYVDFNAQYQQKFNSWLSLFLSVKLAGRLGSDMSTIVADGINSVSGGDIGWLIKLKETEKFILSGSIKATALTGNFINVAEYLQDVIEGEPYPTLSKKVPSTSVGIGLRAAYAFNPSYGLQANFHISQGESLQRGTIDNYVTMGILGDVNLNIKYEVPISLALGYSLTSTPEVSMDNRGYSSLYTGKIDYTGSNDYELGLQFTFYDVQLKSVEANTSISKVMLGLKFYL